MTPESLSKEISRLSGELKRLNGLRMANTPYRVRSRNVERLIIEHAEQIARLQNFLSHMRTKEMISGL